MHSEVERDHRRKGFLKMVFRTEMNFIETQDINSVLVYSNNYIADVNSIVCLGGEKYCILSRNQVCQTSINNTRYGQTFLLLSLIRRSRGVIKIFCLWSGLHAKTLKFYKNHKIRKLLANNRF